MAAKDMGVALGIVVVSVFVVGRAGNMSGVRMVLFAVEAGGTELREKG